MSLRIFLADDHEVVRRGLRALFEERMLTAREQEVLVLLAEGKGSREISVALGVKRKTAESHRGNLMYKLGMRSLSDLVRHAIRNGIVEP